MYNQVFSKSIIEYKRENNKYYSRDILQKVIVIDSKFRDNYYTTSSSNFIANLPLSTNKTLTMKLQSIEIPISYFVISKQSGNNYFYITTQCFY